MTIRRIELGGCIVATMGDGMVLPDDVYSFTASTDGTGSAAREMRMPRQPWPARYRPRRERRASTRPGPVMMTFKVTGKDMG